MNLNCKLTLIGGALSITAIIEASTGTPILMPILTAIEDNWGFFGDVVLFVLVNIGLYGGFFFFGFVYFLLFKPEFTWSKLRDECKK